MVQLKLDGFAGINFDPVKFQFLYGTIKAGHDNADCRPG